MKTKKRYLGLTTIANWAASIPAKAHFNLVISLMLLLAFAAPSIAQNAQGGKMVSPKVDRHAEALKFRRLMLQDEKGQIPADAWTRAAAQKKLMPFNAKAWPRNHGQNSPSSKQGGAIKPLVAGIESSGWTWLGPGNIGGRVRSILIHPTTPSTMWVGSVGGGVWKTVNGGTSWFPLDDFMANLAICCMVMDPQNPNLIYAGTGEGFGGDRIQGAGIFKTTDGGSTWVQLSSTANTSFFFVNRLAISPNNSQIVLAATQSGIWRSTNAGASWNLSTNSSTLDLAFDPSDGNKCIGSGSGFVVISTNGGMTWTAATGIDRAGRIEIAYAPSNPNIVYASADKNNGELYASTDGGQTYSLRNTGNNYFLESGGAGEQGDYDNCIWVDPTDSNRLVVGGLDLWRSNDGGSTLTDIGGYSGGVHPDQQIIIAHPAFNGTTVKGVFVGNDGGVFRADDIYSASGTSGWTGLNHHLGITQFYGGAGNAGNNGQFIGGAQDNGTDEYTPAGGTEGWSQVIGGDGGDCAADPVDTGYLYGEQTYLRIYRTGNTTSGWQPIYSGISDAGNSTTANFIAPFTLDPNNPGTMLAGGASLWRSTDVKRGPAPTFGPHWTAIKPPTDDRISTIAIAPGNSDIIWVGHNGGEVWSTANGTVGSPTWTQKGVAILPGTFCRSIAIDPNNANQVYATFGGFSSNNVWRTTDAGATWTNLSGNLPQTPVFSIVINPHDSSYLYLGTEVGVFASSDGGASWSPSNDGPANVVVYQLFWVGDTLVAATHGRGMFAIQPIVWVDFNYNGTFQTGIYAAPFHTLAQGVNAVSSGSDIFIKTTGSSSEKMTISKPLTIHAYSGPDTIGH